VTAIGTTRGAPRAMIRCEQVRFGCRDGEDVPALPAYALDAQDNILVVGSAACVVYGRMAALNDDPGGLLDRLTEAEPVETKLR
jgi:hypothetical protein